MYKLYYLGKSKKEQYEQARRIHGINCNICGQSLEDEYNSYMLYLIQIENGLEKKFRLKRYQINIDLDHIIPKSIGGSNNKKNIALTHKTCNQNKGIRNKHN